MKKKSRCNSGNKAYLIITESLSIFLTWITYKLKYSYTAYHRRLTYSFTVREGINYRGIRVITVLGEADGPTAEKITLRKKYPNNFIVIATEMRAGVALALPQVNYSTNE